MAITESRKAELEDLVAAGDRLSYADGVDLYDCDDWPGSADWRIESAPPRTAR
jgi:hypothetical protein